MSRTRVPFYIWEGRFKPLETPMQNLKLLTFSESYAPLLGPKDQLSH